MRLQRFSDWAIRLDAFLLARKESPFAWGSNDCALFAADAVMVMTGVDLARQLRGYKGRKAAMRLLDAHGGLSQLATTRLGEPIDPMRAQRGDLLLVHNGRRNALVICVGAEYVGPGPNGVIAGSLSDALSAWRV